MHLDNVVFIDSLPKIDLHGETSETARVLIEDFIRDSIKQKNYIICIVHGTGSGTLRTVTSETLKKKKNIVAYKTFYHNQGCTIAEIIK